MDISTVLRERMFAEIIAERDRMILELDNSCKALNDANIKLIEKIRTLEGNAAPPVAPVVPISPPAGGDGRLQ